MKGTVSTVCQLLYSSFVVLSISKPELIIKIKEKILLIDISSGAEMVATIS